MDNSKFLIGGVGVIFCLGLVGLLRHHNADQPLVVETTAVAPVIQKPHAMVYISGAVQHPGLYPIQGHIRVQKALEKAGGVLANADVDKVNLAAYVKDGQRIYVPPKKVKPQKAVKLPKESHRKTRKNPTENPDRLAPKEGPTFPLGINTASPEDLALVPGLSLGAAKSIVSYRQEHGPFIGLDGLVKLKGFSWKKVAQLRPYLVVD
ncbi:MAG: helix-hairpin-helix domain-containing protein [Candidatus Margulisiibacteriota bacterium]